MLCSRRSLLAGAALTPWLVRRALGAPRLAALAQARGLLLGTMMTADYLDEADLSAVIAEQCDLIVPGIELKWRWSEPTPGNFDFAAADRLASFAVRNNMKFRGHCMVWHESLPAGFDYSMSRDRAIAAMQSHIRGLAGHYRGNVLAWDVVNECINPPDGLPDGLRETPWWEMIGPDYIDIAYHTAHAADPAAKLVINEFGLDYDTTEHAQRRASMLSLLTALTARGVPVQVLGIQGHLRPGLEPFAADIFRDFIRAVGGLGLEVWITELDVIDRYLPAGIAARDQAAAGAVAEYLGAALAEPNVKVVSLWGMSDRHSWVGDNADTKRGDGLASRPLPYDSAMRAKPMLDAIERVLA